MARGIDELRVVADVEHELVARPGPRLGGERPCELERTVVGRPRAGRRPVVDDGAVERPGARVAADAAAVAVPGSLGADAEAERVLAPRPVQHERRPVPGVVQWVERRPPVRDADEQPALEVPEVQRDAVAHRRRGAALREQCLGLRPRRRRGAHLHWAYACDPGGQAWRGTGMTHGPVGPRGQRGRKTHVSYTLVHCAHILSSFRFRHVCAESHALLRVRLLPLLLAPIRAKSSCDRRCFHVAVASPFRLRPPILACTPFLLGVLF